MGRGPTKRIGMVEGVGINDADYNVYIYGTGYDITGKSYRKVIWRCPFYSKWTAMLGRCYNPKLQIKQPTYIGCTVCNEWLTFSNFKYWMEQQDWEGNALDKDLLIRGNKEYNPQNCVFVSQQVNNFLTEHDKGRGEYPIGVYVGNNRFRAQCCSIETGKSIALGTFDTPDEAHKAWLKFKLKQAYALADQQKDQRVARAIINRYKDYGNGDIS